MTRLICFAARHDSPHHAGHLVCHGYARHARWLPGEQREEARIRSLGLIPGPADQRGRADHKELSQVPVAHLGDVPETVLSAARVLRRRQPEPGGKLSTRAELTWIGNRGCQRCGTDRANARYRRETPGHFIRSLLDKDRPVDGLEPGMGVEHLVAQETQEFALPLPVRPMWLSSRLSGAPA